VSCRYKIYFLVFGVFWMAHLHPAMVHAEDVRVAVAANFAECLQKLSLPFHESTGHEVVAIVGSTGRHFAQISAGAPFDVFLAADQRHPRLLIENGNAVASSCFTYARGCLVLWIADGFDIADRNIGTVLADPRFTRVAMANPRLAPYGEAARQTLANLGLPDDLDGRVILGTSVGQTWQFAATGNTEAAFVALSQVQKMTAGQILIVPVELYDPVDQQAVLLNRAKTSSAAAAFMKFLASPAARLIIQSYGYTTEGQAD